jgi:pyruvate dehydrogenase E2 component (dihydrolipoamide acetyltransferase)
MPKMGMEMTEAVLVRWLVDDGAMVEKGQPLYELETDKVTNEVEALAQEGLTYLVGDPVAELADP